MRQIDLRKIPVGAINLPHQSSRLRALREALDAVGLSFRLIVGVSEKPRFKGCSLGHLTAIRALRGSGPFLVLEDDVVPTPEFSPVLTVPDDADLVYLGHSPRGVLPRGLRGSGETSLVSRRDDGLLRVHSMLAAHAILYLDDAAIDDVEANIAQSCEDETLRRHDIGLCEVQRRRRVLTTEAPLFAQSGEVQGKVKRDLRTGQESFRATPAQPGDRRELVSGDTAVPVVVAEAEDGHLELRADDTEVATTLFGTPLRNIYAGVARLERQADPQGWNSNHPVLEAAIAAIRPARIIEVGVWKGMSVITMAKAARKHDVPCRIYAVDTWLGSPEHWLRDDLRKDLHLRNGFPTLYETFLKNVSEAGVTDMVEPVPIPSETAAFVFAEKGVSAEMIHIDAGHEFESVMRDLRQYVPLLADDGVLIGDDYGGSFPGVRRAFDRYCARNGLSLAKLGRKCICARKPAFETRVLPLLDRLSRKTRLNPVLIPVS